MEESTNEKQRKNSRGEACKDYRCPSIEKGREQYNLHCGVSAQSTGKAGKVQIHFQVITKLAQKTVDALCGTQMIGEEDKDLYIYGFFVLYTRLFFLIITILFSFMFGIVWQGILMYIIFSLIRSYAGGVHASKESICLTATTVALFVCVMVLGICIKWDNVILMSIVLVCACCCIVFISPMDTEEKRLSPEESKRYSRITCLIASLVTFLSCLCAVFGLSSVLYICTVSFGLESILLLIGRFRLRAARKRI